MVKGLEHAIHLMTLKEKSKDSGFVALRIVRDSERDYPYILCDTRHKGINNEGY